MARGILGIKLVFIYMVMWLPPKMGPFRVRSNLGPQSFQSAFIKKMSHLVLI